MEDWVITRSLNTYFTATKYLNRNSYFYSYKAWKIKYGSYSNSYNFFSFILKFLPEIEKPGYTFIDFQFYSS